MSTTPPSSPTRRGARGELEAGRYEVRVGREAPRAVAPHAGERQRHVVGPDLVVEHEAESLGGKAQGQRLVARGLVHHRAGHGREPRRRLAPDAALGRAVPGLPSGGPVGGPAGVYVGRAGAPRREREVGDVGVALGREHVGEGARRGRRVGAGHVERRAIGEQAARVDEGERAVAQGVAI
jgi:hypothetical protein